MSNEKFILLPLPGRSFVAQIPILIRIVETMNCTVALMLNVDAFAAIARILVGSTTMISFFSWTNGNCFVATVFAIADVVAQFSAIYTLATGTEKVIFVARKS